jgi:hypothetical protein
LTNFSNGKQTQESLESGFPESEFQETNMTYISVQFCFCYSGPVILKGEEFLTVCPIFNPHWNSLSYLHFAM